MRRMTTCGGCYGQPPTLASTSDPMEAECAGCASLPVEEFSEGLQDWDSAYVGDTSMTFRGQNYDSDTGQPYGPRSEPRKTFDASGLSVTPGSVGEPGSCAKDAYGICVPATSCYHEITISGTLSYSWTNYDFDGNQIVPSPEWAGPDFEQRLPPGWEIKPRSEPITDPDDPLYIPANDPNHPDYIAPGPINLDYPLITLDGEPVFTPSEPGSTLGTFTQTASVEWEYKMEPGCGATIESAVSAADFVLREPELSELTNAPEDDSEPIRLRLGCAPCSSQNKPPKPEEKTHTATESTTFAASGTKAADGSTYAITGLAYRITAASGTTSLQGGSCAEDTPCTFTVTYEVLVTVTVPTGDPGPDLTLGGLDNLTVATATVSPVLTGGVDNGDTTTTYAAKWSITGTSSPGCGSSLPVAIGIGDLTAETGWSKTDDETSVDSTVTLTCSAAAPITQYSLVEHLDVFGATQQPNMGTVRQNTNKNRRKEDDLPQA
jgi:hypothetical protein